MQLLIGEKVSLRLLSDTYITSYLASFTQEVRSALDVPDIDTEYTYVCERMPLVKDQRTFFYCIFDVQSDTVIGALEIRGIEHPGQLYVWLHPAYWGKGYFQEAMRLAATHYFNCTQSLYFTARVDSTNKRSYRALKKAGFVDYAYIEKSRSAMQYELLCINHQRDGSL